MNTPLKAVCAKHGINFSSAKNVIQIFKKEGRLEKKQSRQRKDGLKQGAGPPLISAENESESDSISPKQSQKETGKKHTLNVEEPEESVTACRLLLQIQDDDTMVLIPKDKTSVMMPEGMDPITKLGQTVTQF